MNAQSIKKLTDRELAVKYGRMRNNLQKRQRNLVKYGYGYGQVVKDKPPTVKEAKAKANSETTPREALEREYIRLERLMNRPEATVKGAMIRAAETDADLNRWGLSGLAGNEELKARFYEFLNELSDRADRSFSSYRVLEYARENWKEIVKVDSYSEISGGIERVYDEFKAWDEVRA